MRLSKFAEVCDQKDNKQHCSGKNKKNYVSSASNFASKPFRKCSKENVREYPPLYAHIDGVKQNRTKRIGSHNIKNETHD